MNETEPVVILNEEAQSFFFQVKSGDEKTLRFFYDNKEVGCFDFGAKPMTFTGDVDASAKAFIEAVRSYIEL